MILGPITTYEIVTELGILSAHQVLGEIRRALREQGGAIANRTLDRKRKQWEHRLVRPGQQALFETPRRLFDAGEGGRRCGA